MTKTNSRLREAMTTDRDKGFTLIELLVVIIIIGILAGVAIPVFLNQRKKGIDAGLKSDVKNAATTVETWITDNPQDVIVPGSSVDGAAATANSSLVGFVSSPGNTVNLVASTGTTGAYCIHAFNANASEAVDANTTISYKSLEGGLIDGAAAPTCA